MAQRLYDELGIETLEELELAAHDGRLAAVLGFGEKRLTGIRDSLASGYVYLKGAFLIAHRDEIERLLRNEAERAAEDNPLARIMLWKENGDGALTLSTTTEHLAQRLGHALAKPR